MFYTTECPLTLRRIVSLYNGVPGKDTEFGANPAGQLIYTKSGYVSVVITDGMPSPSYFLLREYF